MSDLLLEFRTVSHRYPDGRQALNGCSLGIAPGSRNALLGANGAGKTTLFLHALGLLQPDAGEVCHAGQPLAYDRAGLTRLRQQVGLLFQNPDDQLICATVAEDVAFGPLNLDLPAATVRQRVAEALAAVGLPDEADTPVHHLSFGQKKRVCLAGVLAMQPQLLILDEPLAGLDHAMQAELLTLLDRLHAAGTTLLLATHDIDFAWAWADRLHLLHAGSCRASIDPEQTHPALAAILHNHGLPLPQVLPLHQALVANGALPPGPAPRSLAALTTALQAHSANSALNSLVPTLS